MNDTKTDRMLTTEEAAKVLCVKPSTLRVWRTAKRHAIPYVKKGRYVRYRLSDLQAWLDNHTVSD